ncbi:MAG: very short patch repair endonuclease [Ktedonobacterales bacterium]
MTLPPTPPPSDATKSMRANRRRDTSPEMRLRRALHTMGYRYRVDMRLDVPGRRVHADLVFTKTRVAVFVDGCFWHGCPEHCRMPSDPSGYWHAKLRRNVERDRAVSDALGAAGWRVVRIWEHTSIDQAVDQVRMALNPQPQRPPHRSIIGT